VQRYVLPRYFAIFAKVFFKKNILMKLVAVGTVAFDSIETPFGKAERIVGGAATFISISASHFTDEIGLISIIGSDFPKKELTYLERRGVNLDGLQIKKGKKSFFWAGKYHENMNQRDTLDTQLNVLADFDPIVPEAYKNTDYLMLGNLTPDVQMKVIRQMTKRPKLIALDTMNFWMDIAMDSLKDVIKEVDVLIINDEEARQLSGHHSLLKASKQILKMGPKALIIKKGEHGAILFAENDMFYVPALPLEEVFDPTGAGDTFAGGFMGYIVQKDDISFSTMRKALVHASAMASFCVEKFGIEGLKKLNKTMIKSRVKEFSTLVKH
jgi:sugar/nucleoside kinase (ribokinase family)